MINPSRQLPPAPMEIERIYNIIESLMPHQKAALARFVKPLMPAIQAFSEMVEALKEYEPIKIDPLTLMLEIVREGQSNN